MAEIVDLATTTTLNDTDTVVLQPVGDVEPVKMAGSTMRTEFKGTPGADSTVPGPQGNPGTPGADSTVAGPQGNPGTPGADSTVPGPQGNPGADSTVPGPQGNPGTPGADSTVAGPQGLYTVDIYRTVTTGTTPATPTGGTVDVGTGTVIVSPVNWRDDLPTPGAGETLFISRTTINPATQSGNITPTWSTPFEAGGDGPAGPAGPVGPVSTVPGPQGNPGADSTVPGPMGNPGADSTVPGPQWAIPGADSTVPGPHGRPRGGLDGPWASGRPRRPWYPRWWWSADSRSHRRPFRRGLQIPTRSYPAPTRATLAKSP